MAEVLLIATVGGTPETLVSGILAANPARVIFVCSAATLSSITSEDAVAPGIKERLAVRGWALDAGRYDVCEIPDPQAVTSAVERIHREITPWVERWVKRGAEFAVVADFTGGTKCMSVALGLVARSWPCKLQYVGGAERSKAGTGAVVTGHERVMQFRNDPWEVLGYRVVEEAGAFFNHGDAVAAADWMARARNAAGEGPLKSALSALHHYLDLFSCWDRFDHAGGIRSGKAFAKHAYLLAPLFSEARIGKMRGDAAEASRFLVSLGTPEHATREFVTDLAANAGRRLTQGRYDDALARVYRAIEALGQWKLAEGHGIGSTGHVELSSVPEPLRTRWTPLSREGYLKIGLQDTYELLVALGDETGRQFDLLGLSGAVGGAERGSRSPLNARNSSILAHGFRPAQAGETRELWNKLLILMGTTEDNLPSFPQL